MGQIHSTQGAAIPFILDDYNYEVLTAAFDPIGTLHDADNVHPSEMKEQRMAAKYERKGFLCRPNADGDLYAITWRQYQEAIKGIKTLAGKQAVLAALEPKLFLGSSNTWIECALVKVMGTNGDGTGHYETVATACNIGIIL